VLARWKEHLIEGSESEQPTRPVNLRDDGVDIDLPSPKGAEIPENNKGASADSVAAELLKNGLDYQDPTKKLDRGRIVSSVQEGR
jgi:hypothetical protein